MVDYLQIHFNSKIITVEQYGKTGGPRSTSEKSLKNTEFQVEKYGNYLIHFA